MTINIHADLIAAGTQYKKELLAMPVAVLAEALPQMTIRTGIQGKVVGGLLSTDAELRPYRTAKNAVDNTAVVPYEWETYLGDVVKEFDPHAILGTLYTELTAKGVREYDFVKRIAMEMAKKVGEKLFDNLFTAIRNSSGDYTSDLFNGFDTLTNNAVLAGSVSAALHNLQDYSATTMTVANAGDILKEAYRALNPLLRKQRLNLYVPSEVLWMYEDWYQDSYGPNPFNTDVAQRKLVGTNGQCSFVPLNNMSGNFAYFTVKENMNVGFDQQSDVENVRIRECDNPKLVQFFMKAYFGVGFEAIQKEVFNAVKIDAGLNGSGSGSGS